MSKQYESYRKQMQKIADVGHSIAVLQWDKEVNLPKKGAHFRAQQMATLSGIAHELFTNKRFGALLVRLNNQKSLSAKEKKNVKLTLEDYEKSTKFSKEFVEQESLITSSTYHAWYKAKEENDYSLFANQLSKMIAHKREKAEILGYCGHPYNALVEQYERGCTTTILDNLFADLKPKLTNLIGIIKSKEQINDDFLRQDYPTDTQWDFSLDLLEKVGYDFDKGRQDIAPHPFSTAFSPDDARITTRLDQNNLAYMTWSSIHEAGHAMYEQGLPVDEYGLPSGSYISVGIHESQSRLWENNVGRGVAFWKYYYPKLKSFFPKQLKSTSLFSFYQGMNKIEANPIRTEADELHYHFHIMIRYEIEKGLIDGTLSVDNLDKIWNKKYKDYLGITIENDAEGILQDVHWGYGSIGYFPTYSMGSLYAAQFYAQADIDLGGLDFPLRQGNTAKLKEWLHDNIYQYGKQYEAEEICKRITGNTLDSRPFMDYANKKFGEIYGF